MYGRTVIELVEGFADAGSDRFRRGDFTDPARIHGDEMPGLAALRAGAGSMTVDYADTAGGALITYTSPDAALVASLHAWIDAQVSDHGGHATHGGAVSAGAAGR